MDSLTQSTNLPTGFQITFSQRIATSYSTDSLSDIISQLDADILLRYDSRVEEILTFYIHNGEKTAYALAYSKHLESQFQDQLKVLQTRYSIEQQKIAEHRATMKNIEAEMEQIVAYINKTKAGVPIETDKSLEYSTVIRRQY